MKYRLDKVVSPSDQAEAQNYINPAIAVMQQVGSREIEYEIEELKAHGRKIVEVYGYPVVPPPEHVREAAAAAAASTFFPPSSGLLELREALAAALFAQYGFAPDPEKQILITSGAMHARSRAFEGLKPARLPVRPGSSGSSRTRRRSPRVGAVAA